MLVRKRTKEEDCWQEFIRVLIVPAWVGTRILAKSPGFSAVAILVLAVGIGVSTFSFSL